MSVCHGCGRFNGEGNPDANHCSDCPPWRCEDCGQMDSAANPCPCWVSLEGMSMADLKATFAQAGLSLTRETKD